MIFFKIYNQLRLIFKRFSFLCVDNKFYCSRDQTWAEMNAKLMVQGIPSIKIRPVPQDIKSL